MRTEACVCSWWVRLWHPKRWDDVRTDWVRDTHNIRWRVTVQRCRRCEHHRQVVG